MKKLFIVANWKSHKTTAQSLTWLQELSGIKLNMAQIKDKEIIICPSFIQLYPVRRAITDSALPFKLAGQTISSYDEGQYTGEVNGKQLEEFAEYVLIGHSERRTYFSEFDDVLAKKVAMAQKYNRICMYCVQNEKQPIPAGVQIVAYEPPTAIGSSHPDTPQNANEIATQIKQQYKVPYVLYGGSVTSAIVKKFTEMPQLDGVLVGTASLDGLEFLKIINNA